MTLPDELSYGLVAQDVEPILPELITSCVHPPDYDSLGNIVTDSIHYKVLKYEAFIPILIQGIKEQQEIIENYETRFQNIEAMLASCCATTKSGETTDGVEINSVIEIKPDQSLENNTLLHQNQPNPFEYTTTFKYSVGVDGFIELEIHDQYGNFITSLVSENQNSGSYSIDWDAKDIAAGVYFYSLKVNGIVWVKKAIKIK